MERKDIIKIFEKYYSSLNIYKCYLVEIKLTLKDNTELNLLYNSDVQYIDISENYLGLGSFIIKPYENIKTIDVKFRK